MKIPSVSDPSKVGAYRNHAQERYLDIASAIFSETDGSAEKSFLEAVKCGQKETVLKLINQFEQVKDYVDSRDPETRNTALMIAAENNHTDICEILIGKSADATAVNAQGKNALDVAGSGAKQVLSDYLKLARDTQRRLLFSAWTGDSASVTNMLKHDKSHDINCRNVDGYTPLLLVTRDISTFFKVNNQLLAGYNPADVIQELISYNANVNLTGPDGLSALHHLIAADNIDKDNLFNLISCLIENGADLGYEGNTCCSPPLHSACKHDKLDVVLALIEKGSDINGRDYGGATPLHITSFYGHEQIAVTLLEHGADITIVDENGHTAFDVAKHKKMRRCLKEAWSEATKEKRRKLAPLGRNKNRAAAYITNTEKLDATSNTANSTSSVEMRVVSTKLETSSDVCLMDRTNRSRRCTRPVDSAQPLPKKTLPLRLLPLAKIGLQLYDPQMLRPSRFKLGLVDANEPSILKKRGSCPAEFDNPTADREGTVLFLDLDVAARSSSMDCNSQLSGKYTEDESLKGSIYGLPKIQATNRQANNADTVRPRSSSLQGCGLCQTPLPNQSSVILSTAKSSFIGSNDTTKLPQLQTEVPAVSHASTTQMTKFENEPGSTGKKTAELSLRQQHKAENTQKPNTENCSKLTYSTKYMCPSKGSICRGKGKLKSLMEVKPCTDEQLDFQISSTKSSAQSDESATRLDDNSRTDGEVPVFMSGLTPVIEEFCGSSQTPHEVPQATCAQKLPKLASPRSSLQSSSNCSLRQRNKKSNQNKHLSNKQRRNKTTRCNRNEVTCVHPRKRPKKKACSPSVRSDQVSTGDGHMDAFVTGIGWQIQIPTVSSYPGQQHPVRQTSGLKLFQGDDHRSQKLSPIPESPRFSSFTSSLGAACNSHRSDEEVPHPPSQCDGLEDRTLVSPITVSVDEELCSVSGLDSSNESRQSWNINDNIVEEKQQVSNHSEIMTPVSDFDDGRETIDAVIDVMREKLTSRHGAASPDTNSDICQRSTIASQITTRRGSLSSQTSSLFSEEDRAFQSYSFDGEVHEMAKEWQRVLNNISSAELRVSESENEQAHTEMTPSKPPSGRSSVRTVSREKNTSRRNSVDLSRQLATEKIREQVEIIRSGSKNENIESAIGDVIRELYNGYPVDDNEMVKSLAKATVSDSPVQQSRLDCHSPSQNEPNETMQTCQIEESGDILQWRKGYIIGQGAFGRVWCGLTSGGELIAVKQIEIPNLDRKKTILEYRKVQQEVLILKELKHPNIVTYIGTSFEQNSVNIFMQYIPGGSIYQLLLKFGPLEEAVFSRYTKQIVDGVGYLHCNGVVHRDIKGANIMLMPNGTIKLIDFGCAKRLFINMSWSQSCVLRSMQGSPYWMSPEVVRETGHGKKSDIWSIGCTVFEMATRKPPWAHLNKMAALFSIGSDEQPVPDLPYDFSCEARDFVSRCLQRDQKLRPSANELADHPFINGII